MHLDVIEGFALAEVVVIGGGEQTSSVAPHDRLQVSTVDVEGERFESVHVFFALSEIVIDYRSESKSRD